MADEAFNCFTSLLESIPTWIADLEDIVKSTIERQKDILRENQPADSPQDQSPKPTKSPSVRTRRSQRSKDVDAEAPQSPKSEEPATTLLQNQLPHMTQSDALRLAQRKRKTVSACTDRQSGPLKYRSKNMVVVYYDGDIQKRFEAIVRAIGSTRNSLRRGKMSAKVDAISRSDTFGSKENSGTNGTASLPTMPYRSARMRQNPGLSKADGTETFDKIDGFLEKAQTLCERAAHQVLRDGDCGVEIKNAREHFVDAQKLSESELPTWEKRAEEAAERQRLSDERRRDEEEEDEKNRQLGFSSNEKLIVEDSFSSPAILEVDLEPDDSDGGDDTDGRDFTVNVMQLGRPYMRASGLTAH